MLQLKVGIHLPSLRLPMRQALPLAAKLGADAVEIDAQHNLRPGDLTQTALRQLRKTLADYRLRVCAVSLNTRHGYSVLENLDRRVAFTKEAMQMAHSLGASVVVNHVGQIPAEPEGPQWNLLVEVLTDIGRHGLHVGAMLAAHPGIGSGAELARLIAALPEGSLGVDFDPGQIIVNGFSPTEAMELLSPHVLHVHATDGVRDLARGRNIEVPLGRGSVDYLALLSVLEQRGYQGYFTIRREAAQDAKVEIGQAVQYLRNL